MTPTMIAGEGLTFAAVFATLAGEGEIMKKTIASALLALAVCAPAAAQTYELTFSGTFTKLHTTGSCESCAQPVEPLSVPFKGTWNITVAAQSTVSTFDYDDERLSSHSLISSFVDQASLDPTTAIEVDRKLSVPHGTGPAGDYVGETTARDLQHFGRYTATGDLSRAYRELLLTRLDIWTVSPDTSWLNVFSLSVSAPVKTPGTFEAPMTSASFIETLQRLVGCIGCMQAQNQSSYAVYPEQDDYIASGTATLLSFRELASPVPEPSSMLMLAAGVATLGGVAWRRRRKQA